MIIISEQVPKIVGRPPNVYSGFAWRQIAFIEDDDAIEIAINFCKSKKGKFMIDINLPDFEPIYLCTL